MAKRKMETLIKVKGQHRPICIGEILEHKRWPDIACHKATWQQLREAAQEILDEEVMEHQDYLESGLYD